MRADLNAVSELPPRAAGALVLDLLEAHFASPEVRALLAGVPEELLRRSLLQPARDFLSETGKQFRARLVRMAWELAQEGEAARAPLRAEVPLLIELIHAGSLIVDDVEDGAPERRGKPALHVLWGEPLAINTGNWLYFWPLTLLPRLGLPAGTELALHRATSTAVLWCHHGQALDLAARVGDLSRREVANVVRATSRLKTGVLMELAATMGAIVAECGEPRATALARFGREFGIGLQMLNDVVGLRRAAETNGDAEDLRNERATWCWAWAAASLAPASYDALRREARRVAAGRANAQRLVEGLRPTIEPGLRTAREHLEAALHTLTRELGPGPGVAALRVDLERLIASHA